MDGKVSLEQFSDRRIRDKRLRRLIQKVAIEEDPQMTRQYPKAVPNEVIVTTRSGRMLKKKIDYPKGHAKRPISDAEVEIKFRNLTRRISTAQQDKILDTLWNLEKVKDAGEILKLFSINSKSEINLEGLIRIT
jgi:2-methylcitrate dehydratase